MHNINILQAGGMDLYSSTRTLQKIRKSISRAGEKVTAKRENIARLKKIILPDK